MSSWRLQTRRSLKDEEIVQLANLLSLLSSISFSEPEDVRFWRLENSDVFTVNSLGKIGAVVSTFPKDVYSVLNLNIPKRVNFLTWILLVGKVNKPEILQKKLPFMVLQPSVCLMCAASGEFQRHVFFSCPYAAACWDLFFTPFNLLWVWDLEVSNNILQLLCGARFHVANLLWINGFKALIS